MSETQVLNSGRDAAFRLLMQTLATSSNGTGNGSSGNNSQFAFLTTDELRPIANAKSASAPRSASSRTNSASESVQLLDQQQLQQLTKRKGDSSQANPRGPKLAHFEEGIIPLAPASVDSNSIASDDDYDSDDDGNTTLANGSKKDQQMGKDGQPSKPRGRPGRKPITTEPANKRTAQNRAAQRAFRERRARYVQDLEARVATLETEKQQAEQSAEDLRRYISKLQAENNALRNSEPTFEMAHPALDLSVDTVAYNGNGLDDSQSQSAPSVSVTSTDSPVVQSATTLESLLTLGSKNSNKDTATMLNEMIQMVADSSNQQRNMISDSFVPTSVITNPADALISALMGNSGSTSNNNSGSITGNKVSASPAPSSATSSRQSSNSILSGNSVPKPAAVDISRVNSLAQKLASLPGVSEYLAIAQSGGNVEQHLSRLLSDPKIVATMSLLIKQQQYHQPTTPATPGSSSILSGFSPSETAVESVPSPARSSNASVSGSTPSTANLDLTSFLQQHTGYSLGTPLSNTTDTTLSSPMSSTKSVHAATTAAATTTATATAATTGSLFSDLFPSLPSGNNATATVNGTSSLLFNPNASFTSGASTGASLLDTDYASLFSSLLPTTTAATPSDNLFASPSDVGVFSTKSTETSVLSLFGSSAGASDGKNAAPAAATGIPGWPSLNLSQDSDIMALLGRAANKGPNVPLDLTAIVAASAESAALSTEAPQVAVPTEPNVLEYPPESTLDQYSLDSLCTEMKDKAQCKEVKRQLMLAKERVLKARANATQQSQQPIQP